VGDEELEDLQLGEQEKPAAGVFPSNWGILGEGEKKKRVTAGEKSGGASRERWNVEKKHLKIIQRYNSQEEKHEQEEGRLDGLPGGWKGGFGVAMGGFYL